jgi:glycosyltransferase involved in cell wall biosynthesis
MRALILVHGHPELSQGGTELAAYALFQHLKASDGVAAVFIAASPEIDPGGGRNIGAFRGRSDELLIRTPSVDEFTLSSNEPARTHDLVSKVVDFFKPDVVHIHHFAGTGLSVVPFLKSRRIPVVLTLHDLAVLLDHYGQGKSASDASRSREVGLVREGSANHSAAAFHVRTKLLRRQLSAADALVAPSKFAAQRLMAWEGLLGRDIEIIENPLSPHVLETASGNGAFKRLGKLHFAFFGRFSAAKGVHVLLKAISLLDREEQSQLRLDLFGGGLERQPSGFQKEVRGLLKTLRGVVTDQGMLASEQVHSAMSSYDWIVVPSTSLESSPLVIQEALASGVPVLASDIGGVGEKVAALDGQLVPAGNPTALARYISAILSGDVSRPVVDVQAVVDRHRDAASRYLDLLRSVSGYRAPTARPIVEAASS